MPPFCVTAILAFVGGIARDTGLELTLEAGLGMALWVGLGLTLGAGRLGIVRDKGGVGPGRGM